jgi:tetratricopeptide (TPR) repeat protein
MGHILADNCEFDKSLDHLNKGLQINTMANILWGISVHKSCIARTVYLYQGKVNVGYPMSCEGLRTAEESGDTYSKAEAHLSMGFAYLQKRQMKDAEEHLLTCCDICERTRLFPALHSMAEGSFGLGDLYFSTGQYGKSKRHVGNCIQVLNSNSMVPSWARTGEMALARAMVMNNEGVSNLDTLLTYPDRNRIKLADGKIRKYLAEILLHLDDYRLHEAEGWIHEAIKADKRNGLLFDLATDLIVCGDVYKRRKNHPKAREAVEEAIRVFQVCGADGWARKYSEELASFS